MANINQRLSPHAGRIERWLGAEKAEYLSQTMRGWYGPPINIRDVPGSLWLTGDGDFVGDFGRGGFASAADALRDHLKSFFRRLEFERGFSQHAFGVGFTSISDALARASSGDGQMLNGGQIAKSGSTGVVGSASSLWRQGSQPASGATSAAAPAGAAPTKATTGAMRFNNPSSGTLHLVGADFSANVINNCVMLYDRIFNVAKTMNSTATEAVTGVPTRYQNTTPGTEDSAEGNFLFIEVGGTALAATAHNWTTCLYTDSDGNANQTLPSVTGNSGAIVDRFDMPVNNWFCPLASGDAGIKDLDQMQCSAAVATGVINFVIGHPIGVMAFPVINSLLPFDWLTNRRQAPRIFDDACLALFELPKPATNATTYNGQIYVTRAAP
jgi:hypothetical protein